MEYNKCWGKKTTQWNLYIYSFWPKILPHCYNLLTQSLPFFQREIQNDRGILFCQSNRDMNILSLPGKRLGSILCKICVYNTDPEDYKQKNSILCESIKWQIQILCVSTNKWNFKIHVIFWTSFVQFLGLLRITYNRHVFPICLLISLEKLTSLGNEVPS